MTPAQRKKKSEAALKRLRVPINDHLPSVESEKNTKLRTQEELFHRLVALWAVAGAAHLPDEKFFRDFMVKNKYTGWLSPQEKKFLLAKKPNEKARIHFSWQIEPLYFLAWCGGLVKKIGVPKSESSVGAFMKLFPREGDDLFKLWSAIKLRKKSEILDWSDMLFRLHWAVRQAHIDGEPFPRAVIPGAVQEWHRAVNWMTCYDGENDWDMVGTDT